MPSREHRDATYVLSSSDRSSLRLFVLQNRLGMIPDAEEDYFSVQAIAAILNREEATIRCWIPRRTTPRHPLGPYFRLSVVMKAMAEHVQSRKKRRKPT